MIYAFIDIKITYFYHHVILHPMQDANSHLVLKKNIFSLKNYKLQRITGMSISIFFQRTTMLQFSITEFFFQEPNV